MGRRKKKSKGRKVRISFRPNRGAKRRSDDWTRRYHDEHAHDALVDERGAESVRAKGDLSRKRTIIIDEETELPVVDEAQWRSGRVVAVYGLVNEVMDAAGELWQCTVRRVLRTVLIGERSSVTVGDRVWFSDQSAHWDGAPVGVIERVDDRASELLRRDRRGKAHAIVANAEQLLIVASLAEPALKPHLVDRYLVAAEQGGLRPVIVFNKVDLLEAAEQQATSRDAPAPEASVDASVTVDYEDDDYAGPRQTPREIIAVYASLGYECILASASTGVGVAALAAALQNRITVLSGQSGVGKSSLVNAVQPGLQLRVGEVSHENEKGRHTTTLARMIPLQQGGWVVDTPGIRQFELWNVSPPELEALFIEFAPYLPACRFRDCLHRDEAGCGVREAVEAGTIDRRRYLSYVKMYEDLSAAR